MPPRPPYSTAAHTYMQAKVCAALESGTLSLDKTSQYVYTSPVALRAHAGFASFAHFAAWRETGLQCLRGEEDFKKIVFYTSEADISMKTKQTNRNFRAGVRGRE